MNHSPRPPDTRTPTRRLGPVAFEAAARQAAALGAAAASADAGPDPTGPDDLRQIFAAWRRLRRRHDRQTRQLLRVAFDIGYGQAVQARRPGLVSAD